MKTEIENFRPRARSARASRGTGIERRCARRVDSGRFDSQLHNRLHMAVWSPHARSALGGRHCWLSGSICLAAASTMAATMATTRVWSVASQAIRGAASSEAKAASTRAGTNVCKEQSTSTQREQHQHLGHHKLAQVLAAAVRPGSRPCCVPCSSVAAIPLGRRAQ